MDFLVVFDAISLLAFHLCACSLEGVFEEPPIFRFIEGQTHFSTS